jgi:hypothetical protein
MGHLVDKMAEQLVELTRVETSAEVEVIISMLSAYANYAGSVANFWKGCGNSYRWAHLKRVAFNLPRILRL